MSRIEAIYRRGVFEPLEPVQLGEEQRVQLTFELADHETRLAWLNHVKAIQAAILARQGVLADSSAEIAADRVR
jgi:predicted DNA-binding antitoxin AbrB/MazE fold protein